MIRSIVRLILVALLSLALSGSLVGAAHAKPAKPFPDNFDLPVGFLPEGIAIGPGDTAYFGSRADGDIYAVNLRTGEGSVISNDDEESAGLPAVGLKIDDQGRLFVAGGPSGTGRVLDARTGELLEIYSFTGRRPSSTTSCSRGTTPGSPDSLSAELYRGSTRTRAASLATRAMS